MRPDGTRLLFWLKELHRSRRGAAPLPAADRPAQIIPQPDVKQQQHESRQCQTCEQCQSLQCGLHTGREPLLFRLLRRGLNHRQDIPQPGTADHLILRAALLRQRDRHLDDHLVPVALYHLIPLDEDPPR